MRPMNSTSADDKHLTNPRYVRWQGIAITQFTVAIALLSTLSISMLAGGAFLALHEVFPNPGTHGLALGLSMLMLVTVVFLCLLSTVSRMLDFRLTARNVWGRGNLTIFGQDMNQFGRLSWFLFWAALSLFIVGGVLFVASACLIFAPKLLGGA